MRWQIVHQRITKFALVDAYHSNKITIRVIIIYKSQVITWVQRVQLDRLFNAAYGLIEVSNRITVDSH